MCLGNQTRKKLPSWLFPALGYALSVGCLIWVFHGINLQQMLEDFATLDWRYVTLAVIFDLSVYVCHGWRWCLLLRPVVRPPFWRAVQSIYIGLFANEVLPLRTGELIRCYLLAFWAEFPPSISLSSAAIERMFDGFLMIASLVVVTSFVPLPRYLIEAGHLMAVLLVLATAVLAFVMFRKHHAHAAVKGSRWAAVLQHVVDGLHAMGNWKTLSASAGASLLYLLLQVVPVWALTKGYGLDLSIGAAFAILIILRLGTVIPNAPGNVGSYQFFCVLSLGLFGIDKTTAAGFSVIMFGVLTLPLLIGGFIAVALTGLKLGEIRHRARTGFRPAPAPEN